MRRPLALAALATLALAGCGLGAGPTPHGVALDVTDGFGSRQILSTAAPQIVGSDTVMRLLERNAKVTTRYGGGFVQSINGLSGGSSVDWFYYVNGSEAPKGAAETDLHPGDHVWWDRHDWTATDDVPEVVGSFPEPFLDGFGGQRLPTRIECSDPEAATCGQVTQALVAYDIPAAEGGIGLSEQNEALRVLVGPWSMLDQDQAAAQLAQAPDVSGVYARFVDGGSQLDLLNAKGATTSTAGPGTGLVAATRVTGQQPVWLVTGTDAAGVSAAVQAFNADTLDGHFAVAVVNGGGVPLPVGGGG